eukprot:EG_transcript_26699
MQTWPLSVYLPFSFNPGSGQATRGGKGGVGRYPKLNEFYGSTGTVLWAGGAPRPSTLRASLGASPATAHLCGAFPPSLNPPGTHPVLGVGECSQHYILPPLAPILCNFPRTRLMGVLQPGWEP